MKKTILFFLTIAFLFSCQNKKGAIDYVDPFIGTGFHGHTYPGATAPLGAVQLSPDTRKGDWDSASGYHYSDSTIMGFSHTHLSGTGCTDLADILFHPTTKDLSDITDLVFYDPIPFSHKDEKASPGYYSVNFKDKGILAELTATTYAAVHRYTFTKGSPSYIIIDLNHLLTDEMIDLVSLKQTGANEITGMRRTQGWVTNQYIYFVAQFSKPFEAANVVGGEKQALVNFGLSDGNPIVAKVGISIVSEENARANLLQEVPTFDFDAIHLQTKGKWEKELDVIKVESDDESALTNFYTAMYHSRIVPNVASDLNGQFRKHDMTIGQLDKNEKYYSTFSIWDTYRAWNPLMTMIDCTLVNNMVNSYIEMYNASGELPIWPLAAGETGTMIGYHAVSIIADAYLKGILKENFDIEHAYKAMKVSSEINKKGSDYYIKYGFIPSNIKRESVSCLLEYAYDDWCIAQVAHKLGKYDDEKIYKERALSYINVFDGNTKFFRGKRLDGNWESPFNPYAPGRAYTEATAWQYRFAVPHDVHGMVQLFGGQEKFIESLDELFTAESKIDGDMVDITGMIGQYVQGNEPSHHMAYLYSYIGQPWKTQYWTRRILNELYAPTPEGISGNEDCGQMSAWYILSSLGFYQVLPGSNQLVLTSPIFDKATLQLSSGKTLEIIANNPKQNTYIDQVILNGELINTNYITYEQLMNGGVLEYKLINTPNKSRGVEPQSYPYSLSSEKIVSIPFTTSDVDLFLKDVSVPLQSTTDDAKIYYTLDGSEPTKESILYKDSIIIHSTKVIKAKAFKEGYLPSKTFEIKATKAELKNPLSIAFTKNGVNYNYYEGLFSLASDVVKAPIKKSGTMLSPAIDLAEQEDHFAFIFDGYIKVSENGVYEFMTKSDDGSLLYIDNELVVNNDGSHAAITATGRIALKEGIHQYKIIYFEDYEGEHFSWGWKTPSSKEFTPIDNNLLFIQ